MQSVNLYSMTMVTYVKFIYNLTILIMSFALYQVVSENSEKN